MSDNFRFEGVLTPVITPFGSDLLPDSRRFVSQCKWLLDKGVGLAAFGTNSEGNSLSVEEKVNLLDDLVYSGVDPLRLMPGTGCCSLHDSIMLAAHATQLGCGGTLMLPPFYYKNVSEDGLYASYAEVIERTGSANLKIYLYNIPHLTQIPMSIRLIDRLKADYPNSIVGIKDSSGDWDYTQSLHDAGWNDFHIFVGSEAFLLQNMRSGGAGCISATANVNPAAIVDLYHNWQGEQADKKQQDLIDVRSVFSDYPMIAALKAATAHFSEDDVWDAVRPPLTSLTTDQKQSLLKTLQSINFQMPGLGQVVN